jgi:hypothetical protein
MTTDSSSRRLDQQMRAAQRLRPVTIVAQDPAVRMRNGRILTTQIDIPAEELANGPYGYRVHVVDYDSSTGKMQHPAPPPPAERPGEPRKLDNSAILDDPAFHSQNVYAVVMRALWRFEYALGRRLGWGFGGHQLKVVPHAFAETNAFFSPGDEALLFGYFASSTAKTGRVGTVFSSLSHDVVVHEATHALLNGLRSSFMRPSGADQAGFHEGFADVVALLSVLSLPQVVEQILDLHSEKISSGYDRLPSQIPKEELTLSALKNSLLLGLAEEMGQELSAVRGQALRRSVVDVGPSKTHYTSAELQEPHRRGEILVAAIMNAFLHVWHARLHSMSGDARNLERRWVAEEAAASADYLLTMAVRAIDYCPPVHVDFRDYLTAMLTADEEIRPTDTKYKFRGHLKQSFSDYGIDPAYGSARDGQWERAGGGIDYSQTRFESLLRDRDEVFRFAWQNRKRLNLADEAYTRVLSVRPAFRVNPDDGFYIRETVIECLQSLVVQVSDLHRLGIPKPNGFPDSQAVSLYGGVTLIFDEFGQLKFDIHKNLPTTQSINRDKHAHRLEYAREYGYIGGAFGAETRFAELHQRRALYSQVRSRRHDEEQW